MKTIVIYYSQTGFTKRYAEWIAEEAGAECVELAAAKKKDLSAYEAIIFGSWACAGGIRKIGWFRQNIGRWADKKRIVFCVGGSPMDSPEIEAALRKNFGGEEWNGVEAFYCPGGFCYERMSVPSRLMMKIFLSTLRAKKEKTKEEQEMIKMISSSYDISDRKYIGPIVECLREERPGL